MGSLPEDEVESVVLDHDHRGAGSDLVFLHAAIGDRRLWDDQWPWVTFHATVRCGVTFAASAVRRRCPVRSVTHGDVVDTLDSADVERTVLVAGSLGGPGCARAGGGPGRSWSPPSYFINPSPSRLRMVSGHPERSARLKDKALERGDIESAVELNLRTWFDGPNRPSMAVDAGRRDEVAAMQRRAFELQLAAGDDTRRSNSSLVTYTLGSPRSSRERSFWSIVPYHPPGDFHAIGALLTARDSRRSIPDACRHRPRTGEHQHPELFNTLLADALARFA